MKTKYWILLITLLAAVLRFSMLTEPSIISDELSSVRDSAKIYQNPIKASRKMVKVVGYLPIALGLHLNGVDLSQIDTESYIFWREQGVTPWAIRMFPALIGTFSVLILGLASRKMLGDTTALIIALLLAISPWHIYWSQFARFYVLQLLFYSLALILYYQGTREKSHRKLASSMVMIILSFACQFTSAAFFFIIGFDWLINRKKLQFDRFTYAIIAFTALILGGMLLLSVTNNLEGWNENLVQSTGRSPINFATLTLGKIGIWVVIAAMCAIFIRGAKVQFLFLAAIIPLVIMSALSFRAHSGPRYAIICLYPWLALAAITINQLKISLGKPVAWVALCLLMVSFIKPIQKHYSLASGTRRPWNEVAQYVRERYKEGEKIYFRTPKVGKFYLGDLAPNVMIFSNKIPKNKKGLWVVVREKDYKKVANHPILSQAKLQKKYVLRKSRKNPKEVSIFYLNPIRS